MATEMVEYRPGRWVKVVDGRIVGRATAEEVAAWKASGGATSPFAAPDTLDVDLDLSPPPPAPDPGRLADVSRRPAFERRGRKVEPTAVAPPSPAGPRPADAVDPDLTIEMALIRDAARRRRAAPDRAQAEPVTVRRRLPALDLPPPGQSSDQPITEETSLPKRPKTRRPEGARTPAPSPTLPSQEAPAPAASAAEPQDLAPDDSGQAPSYWWICNAQRQPVDSFLKEWLPRYKAKFGREATFVLCHEDDLEAALACGLQADASPLLQPGHFYLSHADDGVQPGGKKGG